VSSQSASTESAWHYYRGAVVVRSGDITVTVTVTVERPPSPDSERSPARSLRLRRRRDRTRLSSCTLGDLNISLHGPLVTLVRDAAELEPHLPVPPSVTVPLSGTVTLGSRSPPTRSHESEPECHCQCAHESESEHARPASVRASEPRTGTGRHSRARGSELQVRMWRLGRRR
jgi:hypothetical protein